MVLVTQGRHLDTFGSPRLLTATLEIVAPELADYRYSLLKAVYPVEIYPLDVEDYANGDHYECKNEPELLDALEEILSSDKVHAVVASLMSQSASDE